MSLPFTEQQCFFVVILAFIVTGFMRGWRRELMSLVFVLLASFIVRQDTSNTVGGVISRMPAVIGYAASGSSPQPTANTTFLGGPFWSLIIFASIVGLGYYIGNRAFPLPCTSQERFIGVVPSVIAGAFVLGYLSSYFRTSGGRSALTVDVQSPDPMNYLAIIFIIAIIAVVVAMFVARRKNAPPAKK
jgi:hypothetical protein